MGRCIGCNYQADYIETEEATNMKKRLCGACLNDYERRKNMYFSNGSHMCNVCGTVPEGYPMFVDALGDDYCLVHI